MTIWLPLLLALLQGPPPCASHQDVLIPSAGPGAIGRSVAFRGDTAVVGDPGGGGANGVFVFVRTAGGWVEQANLVAESSSFTVFGHALAVDGDRLVATAPGSFARAGAAHVFVRQGTVWSQEVRLEAPSPALDDQYGASVSLRGDLLLVGAPEIDRAFLYRRSGSSWQLEHTFAGLGEFGSAVHIDATGERAAVGAPVRDPAAQGAVYVYERDATGWIETALVRPAVVNSFSMFGGSVALEDDALVVGAADYGLTRGAMYFFTSVPGGWTQREFFTGPFDSSGFGTSVALEGGTVLVTQRTFPIDGRVRVFARHGVGLVEEAPFETPDPVGAFATSVVLDGGVALVASIGSGAFVYDVCPPTPFVYCAPRVNSQFCAPQISFTGAPSASDPTPFRIDCDNLIPDQPGLLLYSLNGRGFVPFNGGTLCLKARHVRFLPATTTGSAGSTLCTGTLSRDFNAIVQSGWDPNLQPGQAVNAQYVYVDPGLPGGTWTGHSDAIEFAVGP